MSLDVAFPIFEFFRNKINQSSVNLTCYKLLKYPPLNKAIEDVGQTNPHIIFHPPLPVSGRIQHPKLKFEFEKLEYLLPTLFIAKKHFPLIFFQSKSIIQLFVKSFAY
jgi:hypothetical protein